MSVPAARVRTSSGWRDIAIQGPQGIAGRTPSARATSAITFAAADTNYRGLSLNFTTIAFDDFGSSFSPASAFTVRQSGRYLIGISFHDLANTGNVGVTCPGLLRRVSGTVTKGADGNLWGIQVWAVADLTAGTALGIAGYHSGGGGGNCTLEAIRLDAPAVSVPSNSPAYLTAAQFAALTPIDGMEVYLIVDATNGVIWHLRYNASSSSAYKWEYLGGSPMHAFVATAAAAANSAYIDIGGGVPALTPPLAGDYVVRHGCQIGSASGSAIDAMATVKYGAAAAADADAVRSGQPNTSTAFEGGNVMREYVKTSLAAATLLKHQYKDSTLGQAVFSDRFITVLPVRVG